jgi:hypothetical protein
LSATVERQKLARFDPEYLHDSPAVTSRFLRKSDRHLGGERG